MELGFAHGPLRALGEIPFRSGIRRVANHGLVQHLVTLVQGTLDDTPHLIHAALHPPAARWVHRCKHSAARPTIADGLRTLAGGGHFPIYRLPLLSTDRSSSSFKGSVMSSKSLFTSLIARKAALSSSASSASSRVARARS